jgi:hypothetical protein
MRDKADKNARLVGLVLCLACRFDRSPALPALFQVRVGIPALVG